MARAVNVPYPTHIKALFFYQQMTVSHHGSNSWMMLSNLITANRRELNPTSHASANIANDNRLFHPPEFHIDVRMSVFTPASAIFATFTTFWSIDQWKLATVGECGSNETLHITKTVGWSREISPIFLLLFRKYNWTKNLGIITFSIIFSGILYCIVL